MTRTVCDGCGKTITEKLGGARAELVQSDYGKRAEIKMTKPGIGGGEYIYDLCPDCAQSMLDYLRGMRGSDHE